MMAQAGWQRECRALGAVVTQPEPLEPEQPGDGALDGPPDRRREQRVQRGRFASPGTWYFEPALPRSVGFGPVTAVPAIDGLCNTRLG
jgi:hypothetical protein